MYVKLCVCVCVCVCVCERERDYIFQLFVFCKCCTFWCLDDRARGLPYKALWLPHANSDALCFPWWVWTKPKLDTVWLWMERYYLSLTVLYVGVLYPCHLASKCATNIYKKNKTGEMCRLTLSLSLSLSLSLTHTHTHTHKTITTKCTQMCRALLSNMLK